MTIKYESAVEKATVEAFKKEYERIHFRICFAAMMCRREGLLSIEKFIDKEKDPNGDPLEFALQMVVDGMENAKIEEYLDFWIGANSSGHCEYYNKILFSVIKTGILSLQSGENPRMTDIFIKSIIPMELLPTWTEFYPEGIKQYGWLIQFIPEAFRTEEICCNAIKNCGIMLEYVPEKFKTKELCTEATEQYGCALEFVPKEFKTEEFCRKAVEQDGCALEFVPEEFKTEELCVKAVKQNGWALKYVPEKFKTQELCAEATEHYGCALEFVPKEFKTKELCLEAVKNSPFAIKDVPKRLKTVELYIEVVKSKRKWWGEDFVTIRLKDLLDDDIPESLKNEVFEAVYQEELEVKNG
ncbi:MAG: DUF4116 domain-containing protein [Fibromonadaceae bacterium]|nr:DUF4116 domain-containing protein [Fibromonadaceae bacterium]